MNNSSEYCGEYCGEQLSNIVCVPVDDSVIGVLVSSQLSVLPCIEEFDPPKIPCCNDRHIIRTENNVVVVDVVAKIKVYPRRMTLHAVRQLIKFTVMEESDPISSEELEIRTKQLANRLEQKGIIVV